MVSAPVEQPIRGRPRFQCPICGLPGAVRFPEVPDIWHDLPGSWDVRRCEPCQTLWMDPEPLAEELPRLYPDSYHTHGPPWDVLDGWQTRIGRARRALKLQILATAFGYGLWSRSGWVRAAGVALGRIPHFRRRVGLDNVRLLGAPPGRLLDVGCANGSFLRTMSRLGWQVEGIEPDGAAAEQAIRAGLPVQVALLADCRLEPQSYDAVTLHHVLEHLPNPAAAVGQLADALRPGGRLISVSPNPECATARRFGRWWRGLEVPRHLVIPGRRGLLLIAERAGLEARISYSARTTRWLTRQSLTAERGGPVPGAVADLEALVLFSASIRGGGDEVVLEARRP